MIIFSNLWLSRIMIGHANYALPGVNKSVFGETHRKDNLFSKTSRESVYKSDKQGDKTFMEQGT